MHYNQNTKTISLAPASVNQSGTATLIVDTLGFANAQFVVLPQTASATTRVVALSIAEGDTTAAFTNVTGYVGGTNSANGFTLPEEMATSATAVQPLVVNVDCLGKKRYLRLSYTPGTTQVVGAICNLSRPATAPDAIDEAIASQGTSGAHGTGSTTLGVVVNGPFSQLA
ncbi:MAG: hypothetical protein RIS86_669 [Planctomycetota bacterium]